MGRLRGLYRRLSEPVLRVSPLDRNAGSPYSRKREWCDTSGSSFQGGVRFLRAAAHDRSPCPSGEIGLGHRFLGVAALICPYSPAFAVLSRDEARHHGT